MKILQVAPLAVAVPPGKYGGTERVVSYLVEGLVKNSHDVTLIASGDSMVDCTLIAPVEIGMWEQENREGQTRDDYLKVAELQQLALIKNIESEFDIIHFHTSYYHYGLVENLSVPTVTTVHHPIVDQDLVKLHKMYPKVPLISISNAQRRSLPSGNWVGNIYHGMRTDLGELGDGQGGYLAFLGRLVPHKGAHRAIKIAEALGMKIKIAGNTHPKMLGYFENELKPLLSSPHVEYVGEIGVEERKELFMGAAATLFPIEWEEPFGLVMTESMACGTPVIGFRHGSVPEVIEDGVTGAVVDSIEEAAAAFQVVS